LAGSKLLQWDAVFKLEHLLAHKATDQESHLIGDFNGLQRRRQRLRTVQTEFYFRHNPLDFAGKRIGLAVLAKGVASLYQHDFPFSRRGRRYFAVAGSRKNQATG
jgi:hypothetical protein